MKNNKKRLLLSTLTMVIALSTTALNAYSKDDEDIEVITVTASRIEKPITAIPNTVTLIDQEQIQKSIAINDSLSGILSQVVPGFGPQLDKLVGRGESFRGRNPLYLIDGVPQHNALRDGQRDGHTIDMDFVERIEVIHGSNAIQGIGATGGVINMITKGNKNKEGLTQTIKATLSTDDNASSDGQSLKLSYIASGNLGDWQSTFGYSYHERGLIYDANGNAVGLYPSQGDTMDSGSTDLFLKTHYENAEHSLKLMLNNFSLERDGNYVVVKGDRSTGELTGTIKGDPRPLVGDPAENNVTTSSIDYINRNLMSWKLTSQLFYQDFKAKYEGGEFGGYFRITVDGDPVLDQSQIESEKWGLKLLVSRDNFWDKKATVAFGLDMTQDTSAQTLAQTNRYWVPKAELTNLSPFMQSDIKLTNNLLISAGLRYENVKLSVDDYTTIAAAGSTFVKGGKPDFTKVLPNIGLVFDLSDSLALYASLSEGFTMPDVGRVLRGISTPGQDVGNFIDLTPIITENMELGLRYSEDDVSLDFSYYLSHSDLGARLHLNDAGIFSVERERTEINGIDLTANWVVSDSASVGLTYAYINGEYDSDDDNKVDTDLDGVNIAPNKLSAYLNLDIADGITTKISTSHYFTRAFKGIGIAESRRGHIDFDDNYTLVNANINWDSSFGDLSLGIRNLLNKQYLTYFAQTETSQRTDTIFAGAGRTISLSLTKEF
ncbi:MAG: TonB-dependent receptor [Alteromonadales bacterium]|nr:TonB-dependent receptor [Alteromonadales bacterium]